MSHAGCAHSLFQEEVKKTINTFRIYIIIYDNIDNNNNNLPSSSSFKIRIKVHLIVPNYKLRGWNYGSQLNLSLKIKIFE